LEVTRGDVVESRHHGAIAVVGADGQLMTSAGDPNLVAFIRSSAKPFQAVPVVESGAADHYGFTREELAICCSSHNAEPWQQALVNGVLAKIGLEPTALRCGVKQPFDEREAAKTTLGHVPETPLQCECSGEHAGMLAACVRLGFPLDSYLERDHPLQRRILSLVANAMAMPEAEIVLATDGCGIPTFAAPVRAFATAYAALASSVDASADADPATSALRRLASAMADHPRHIAGSGELDTDLIDVSHGRIIAKLGAEGVVCLAVPGQRLGIAIKIGDGFRRACAPVTIAALDQLGLLTDSERAELNRRQPSTIPTFVGEPVGEMKPAFQL
jgi:L-asparaginase II